MEAHEKAVEARWQVSTTSTGRGYYVVARPLTAREAQVMVDGLPFDAFIEPYASDEHDRMPHSVP